MGSKRRVRLMDKKPESTANTRIERQELRVRQEKKVVHGASERKG